MDLDYFKLFTKPHVPVGIARDVEKAVAIIVGYGVPVSEVRLFGSLDNGTWNERRSDIDLAVILDTDEPEYSCFTRIETGTRLQFHHDGDFEVPVTRETDERIALRTAVSENEDLVLRKKYSLHLMTHGDVERMSADGTHADSKEFLDFAFGGRLLYRR